LLSKLHVRNILLLENVELEFKPGLNVLTGETGAGKSILLDCLGFLFGTKSAKIEVGRGGSIGEITGVFELKEDKKLREILEELGYNWTKEIILRRQLNLDNKRKSFFNDTPCSVELLKILAAFLVDLNGQFDEQGLLDRNTHLNFLDKFADSEDLLKQVERIWIKINTQKKNLEKEQKVNESVENIEFLKNSIREIKSLNFQQGEIDSLEKRRKTLKEIMSVGSDLSLAYKQIKRESFEEGIINCIKYLERVEKKIGSKKELPLDMLEDILNNFSRVCDLLEDLSYSSSNREAELLDLENKYFSVKKLMRNHDVKLEEFHKLQGLLEKELENIIGTDQRIKKIEEDIRLFEREFEKLSDLLSQRRERFGKLLDKNIQKELIPLKLERATFRTELIKERATKTGVDRVTFTTSINPGSPFKQLNKVASGGELSRFLLAVKLCLINDQMDISQVFDEIDRGVGGATATAIGRRLSSLSMQGQILVVTHSPQVASFSGHHIKVEKIMDKDKAFTKVKTLNKKEIVEEIARMLSGELISMEAEAAARSLIEASKKIS